MPEGPSQEALHAAILDAYEARLRAEGPPTGRSDDLLRFAEELGLTPAEIEAALARVEASRTRAASDTALTADRAAYEAVRWSPWQASSRRLAMVLPIVLAGEVLATGDAVFAGVVGTVWGARLAWGYARLRWPDPDALERDFMWWRRKRQAREVVDRGIGWVLGKLRL